LRSSVGNVWPDVNPSDFTAILLCAGEAEFIKNFGSNRPLIVLGDNTLLSSQINTIRRKLPGISDIIVVLGFDAERTLKSVPKGVRVILNERWQETSESHSLALALKATITPSALVICGDTYFGIESLTLPKKSTLVVSETGKQEKIGILSDQGIATHLSYGAECKWGQIAYVVGGDLNKLRRAADEKSKLFEIFNTLIAENVEFNVVTKGGITEINSLKDVDNL
jgi:choline kinase